MSRRRNSRCGSFLSSNGNRELHREACSHSHDTMYLSMDISRDNVPGPHMALVYEQTQDDSTMELVVT